MKPNVTEIGYAVHTALRKACDSTPTSILWNLLHTIDSDILEDFYGSVRTAIEDVEYTDLLALARDAKTAWLSAPCVGDHQRVCLHLAGEMMDDGDWQGFVSFLAPELAYVQSLPELSPSRQAAVLIHRHLDRMGAPKAGSDEAKRLYPENSSYLGYPKRLEGLVTLKLERAANANSSF